MSSSINGFFAYARKRENIRLHRESGMAAPWTGDPILQNYRFCNIFREHDTTTQWFRENITDPHYDDPEVALATVIFRWFNRIDTGRKLRGRGPGADRNLLFDWDHDEARRRLEGQRPIITGAYMIKTPPGMDKLAGLSQCIHNVLDRKKWLLEELQRAQTLEVAHECFIQFPYLGAFMAYEIVTDLRWTKLLESATDINSWCSVGPGAARGLGRVMEQDPGIYSYSSQRDKRPMQQHMLRLLSLSRKDNLWPREWGPWEMREVEHTLCEFDKYERARLEEGRPKQKFNGRGDY